MAKEQPISLITKANQYASCFIVMDNATKLTNAPLFMTTLGTWEYQQSWMPSMTNATTKMADNCLDGETTTI
jgi:hypothetical protein